MGKRTGFWTASVAASALTLGCTSLPDHGPPPTLDGPLLSFDSSAATQSNQSQLPQGFSQPLQTVCAPDVTRGFLAEVVDHGFDDLQVSYEWAPIVSGSTTSLPTISQPEFFISGTLDDAHPSSLDFRPSHPFGFDSNWDTTVDAAYRSMPYNRPGDDPTQIHCEIESGLFPTDAFSFTPDTGDRVLMKGSWIFDCGHPSYEAEIHPPTFVAFARSDGTTTTSLAFVNPYRVTQLYGPSKWATSFPLDSRYDAQGVAPFTSALKDEVYSAAFGEIDHLATYVYLEAVQFDSLTWFVCAPDPKPHSNATLGYSYRFVERTGVTLSLARRGDSGCLEVTARMGAAYQPAIPTLNDYTWPWAQIDTEAAAQIGTTIDIRQMILNAMAAKGFTGTPAALQPDASPVIGVFDPLAPRAGADRDDGNTVIGGADDQSFPFYGRVRVYWK